MKQLLIIFTLVSIIIGQYNKSIGAKYISFEGLHNNFGLSYTSQFSNAMSFQAKAFFYRTIVNRFYADNSSLVINTDYQLLNMFKNIYLSTSLGIGTSYTRAYDKISNEIEELAVFTPFSLHLEYYLESKYVPYLILTQHYYMKSKFYDYAFLIGLGVKFKL